MLCTAGKGDTLLTDEMALFQLLSGEVTVEVERGVVCKLMRISGVRCYGSHI